MSCFTAKVLEALGDKLAEPEENVSIYAANDAGDIIADDLMNRGLKTVSI